MNLEPRRGPVFALLCDEQSGALELGLPAEFACSRVVWPQLSVYGQLLRAEMVKDGQALSLQVMSVADNGVSLCDMRHSDEEAHALRKRICWAGFAYG